jgi:hypothetical protein
VRCEHGSAAVCWLCSDDVPWWREARIRAGLGAEPPNEPRYRAGLKQRGRETCRVRELARLRGGWS